MLSVPRIELGSSVPQTDVLTTKLYRPSMDALGEQTPVHIGKVTLPSLRSDSSLSAGADLSGSPGASRVRAVVTSLLDLKLLLALPFVSSISLLSRWPANHTRFEPNLRGPIQ